MAMMNTLYLIFFIMNNLCVYQPDIDFSLCNTLDFWTNENVIIFCRLEEGGSSTGVVVVVVVTVSYGGSR